MGGGARSWGRRRLLGAAGAGALLATGLAADAVRADWGRVSLFSATVALRAPGERVVIPARGGPGVLPGTRITADATGQALAALRAAEDEVRQAAAGAARSARGGAGLRAQRDAALEQAALDLHVLTAGLPAPVAAWSPGWRYVWPRDAAHVAVALAELGLIERADGILRELARLIGPDGWFEARYLPGRRESPDARTRQLDGTGWFLWALHRAASAPAAGPGHLGDLVADPGIARAARAALGLLLDLTSGQDRLPPPSPDYWELPESRPTVAGAALVAAGLEHGALALRAGSGADPRAADLAAQAERRAPQVRAAIRDAFGPTGYGRYPGVRGADAGIMFLLPPYALASDARVLAQVPTTARMLRRPAGGLAPGSTWRSDGISWTPQTALFARPGTPGAEARIDWLIAHRTAPGSLPEKVLADGSCASVAPLAWTAALLVDALLAQP